jgi:Na+/citrate or Na+/malate symporter
VAFTVGNVVWPIWGEQKLFYVPLSVFLLSLVLEVKSHYKANGFRNLLLKYLTLLAWGNVVKQVFYNPHLAQINDYVWGGIVTAWLIYKSVKLKWATRKQPCGKNSVKVFKK